ncbi:hypothetical protein [Streptomyces sp. NPDC001410]|uniref:hypothetical protein n=1 Tax=Streptomyces sp. NPDC001410 TaxID=3364574 RepID=UPI0036A45F3C
MMTVDLAFESLRRRAAEEYRREIRVTWHTLHPPETAPQRTDIHQVDFPAAFRSLDEYRPALRKHDAVVFWGDFLHARHYLIQDAAKRMRHHAGMTDRAAVHRLLVRNLLLAEEADDVLARTLAYGGSILHNAQSDYEDKEYGPAFLRLMTRSNRVWMRDPLSAVKIAQLRGDRTGETFGADAALLSRPEEELLPTTQWSRKLPAGKTVGVFLGSRTEIPDWLAGFCRKVAERLGTQMEWLPWFGCSVPEPFRDLILRPGERTMGDLLAVLPRYRLVITDTYHLALNAWGRRTPVMCVGAPQPAAPKEGDYLTENDLKKQIFHLAYDAADFYLATLPYTSRVQDQRIDRLAQLLEGDGAAAIANRINEHAQRSAKEFTTALTSALDSR